MNSMQRPPGRVLIVGRSPSVLADVVEKLRKRGYLAEATNQFDSVVSDFDVADLDVLVFGGMVPPEVKQNMRDEITRRNPAVTFVQGLTGISGVIAAQVQALASADVSIDIAYDTADRSVRFTLPAAAHVTVEAWWGTSFTPPEPKSTSMLIMDGRLGAGAHSIDIPENVPSVASFAAVTVESTVRVFTIGGMPDAVLRMAPTSASDQRLPTVSEITITLETGESQ